MKRFVFILSGIIFFLGFVYSLDLSNFQGHWRGEGKIIVKWCKQKQLKFDFKINDKGKITGKIGDAKIMSGKIYSNFLGVLNRNYVIEVELKGDILKKEKIKRAKMKIMVDVKGDYLVGDFRSSGLKIGDKKSMAITGVDLVLRKVKEKK